MDQSARYADLSLKEEDLIKAASTFSSPTR